MPRETQPRTRGYTPTMKERKEGDDVVFDFRLANVR